MRKSHNRHFYVEYYTFWGVWKRIGFYYDDFELAKEYVALCAYKTADADIVYRITDYHGNPVTVPFCYLSQLPE